MINQKVVAAGFILLLFLGCYSQTSARAIKADAAAPLRDIVDVMHKQNIAMKHWSLYTKKTGRLIDSPKGYVRMVEEIQSQLPSFQWTAIHKDGDGNVKMTGVHTDRQTKITERLTVLAYPTDNKWRAYSIYEVGADEWNSNHWKRFSPTFRDRIDNLFSKNATIFTCATGHLNATIGLVLPDRAKELLQAFSALPVEQLKEKTFVSLSAYTNKWKQSIQTDEQRMNLQVALRTEGRNSAATVTIGTPIITTEY